MFRDSGRPATPVRTPQQDRSRATRERLISAAIDVLATEGWAASTVSVVAERAGVSRGAAQHHFPTREALITATLKQMFDELTGRASLMDETLPDGPGRIEAVVTRAVDIYTGTQFKAALQVLSAAASDPGLRDLIRPLEREFARAAHRMTVHAIAGDTDDPAVHRLVQATLDMARGLGLADTISDDSARRKQVVATWSEVIAAALT